MAAPPSPHSPHSPPADQPDTAHGEGRTRAEWVTLAVSCLVIVALVVLILTQVGADDAPADPVATVEAVRTVNAQWFVDVVVENHGGETASSVQVIAELTVDGQTTTADQTIDFLAGEEVEDLAFVFDSDPAAGELTVRVATFTVP